MSEKTVKEWLEDLGIDPSAAERYAAGLALPDIGYTKVSELVTIHENRLLSAGVNVGRHRDVIMHAVQGLMAAGSGGTQGISGSPKGAEGSSLALPSDFFRQQRRGIEFEGLKTTPWALKRGALCERLCSIVDREGIKRMLVRGPFASGKTALAQLLHHYLAWEKGETVYILTLLGYSAPWEECWFRQTQVPWQQIIKTREPVWVIIDEVNKSYQAESRTNDLWEWIKSSVIEQHNIRYMCIGSYGEPESSTPTPHRFPLDAIVSLRPHNGTPGFAYTPEEFQDLCKLFPRHGGFDIDDRSANYIFHLTGGHPGIIGWIFKNMYEHAKKFEDVEGAKEDLYKFLHSANLHDSLRNATCRAIPDFSKHPAIGDVCKRVLNGESFKAPRRLFPDNEQTQLDACLKTSILVEVGDSVEFASPVVQDRALAYYFSKNREDPANLRTFIVAVVQRFSRTQFRKTESRDTQSRPLEAQWQHEFSKAAAYFLPRDAIISPEYGREQGVPGQVDFYIAKYKWMIEVVREGLDMARHEQRFEPGGPYAPLINGGDWCVVDFRSAGKEVRRQPRPHTYHVIFDHTKGVFDLHDPLG